MPLVVGGSGAVGLRRWRAFEMAFAESPRFEGERRTGRASIMVGEEAVTTAGPAMDFNVSESLR